MLSLFLRTCFIYKKRFIVCYFEISVLKYCSLFQFVRVIRFAWQNVACLGWDMLGKWHIGDMGCWGCGILGMWDVGDVGSWGCEMLGMWDNRDVGWSGCGMVGMWDVWDVEYSGCGMIRMWDMGCGMVIYIIWHYFNVKISLKLL